MGEVSIVGLNLAKSVFERIMKRFKSAGPTQRFLAVYDQVANLFRRPAHTNAEDHRCARAHQVWTEVTSIVSAV
jgi:putative transposase